MNTNRVALGLCLLLALGGCGEKGGNGRDTSGSSQASSGSSTAADSGKSSTAPVTAANGHPLHPSDLLEAPESFLGKEVEVEILEPLEGPMTPDALAHSEYGRVEVSTLETMQHVLLVPADFVMTDPNRYKKKFDHVLQGPLKVRGTVLHDDDPGMKTKDILIKVASTEAMQRGEPVKAPPVAEMLAHKANWDRKYVVYEGTYTNGFEASYLDHSIWMGGDRDTQIIGTRPKADKHGYVSAKVRVTGLLFAKPGARYGHLGSGEMELRADKIEYLD